MRKFFVFSLFVILSLVIVACSPQTQEVVSEPEAVVEEADRRKMLKRCPKPSSTSLLKTVVSLPW